MKKNTALLFLISLTSGLYAQENVPVQKDTVKTIEEVVINSNLYKYKREKSNTVSKMPLKDIENPQVYNVVTNELLKEQVVTNFNDALKNATGVTRLWESTGRGADGAEFFTVRGFSVQPTMANGLPSLGNGVVDPANTDNIEVIKGPSGALFGSSLISYGGLINIVTKKPYSKFGGEIGYNSGSYGLERLTADVNLPVNKDVSIRINSASHKENSFQDAGFNKSFLFAPSLSYKVDEKLSFLINTEFSNRNSANAPMVFLSRYSPLSFNSMDVFERNYKKSYTSNDLTINNQSFNLQAQMFYKLSENWTSQTALSRSNAKTNGYYAYLWDSANGDEFTRFIAKLNAETVATDIQQNFIGDFKIGSLRNRMVVGIDYYKSTITDGSSNYVGAGNISLVNQTDSGSSILSQPGIDSLLIGGAVDKTAAVTEVVSAYVSDVLNITDALSFMASVRVDRFQGKIATYSAEGISSQVAVSPKFGAVYQIIDNKVSVFGNYMNGFKNIEPGQINVDGTNTVLGTFDPEHANQFEFGFKSNLYKDIISATLSYYDITIKNRLMTDPNNVNASIQGGEVESKGVEVSFTINPTKGLNIITGYSNNKSEVTKDATNSGYLGFRPEEAGPETLVNLWANYTITDGSLKGFGLGFGGNYASEHKTLNRDVIGTFTLPDYTILNTAVSYNSNKFNITLKVNNLLNEKTYSGWSTVTPQRLRSLTAGLTYKF